ncbi:MAG: FHA domain-containing protein [Propionibacteriaceae bacterium]|nr:FHA domain-containing protein [Propionibacteriaceae bacterium]
MSEPIAAWRATYTPGNWVVMSGPRSLVVLPAAPPRVSELLNRFWDEVLDATSVQHMADLLVARNLSQLPNYGLLFWDSEGLHAMTRGSVRFVDANAQVPLASGEEAVTWTEAMLGENGVLRLDLEPFDPSRALHLPVAVGVVSASSIILELHPEARFTSTQTALLVNPHPEEQHEVVAETTDALSLGVGAPDHSEHSEAPASVEDAGMGGSSPELADPARSGADEAGAGGLIGGLAAGALIGAPMVPPVVAVPADPHAGLTESSAGEVPLADERGAVESGLVAGVSEPGPAGGEDVPAELIGDSSGPSLRPDDSATGEVLPVDVRGAVEAGLPDAGEMPQQPPVEFAEAAPLKEAPSEPAQHDEPAVEEVLPVDVRGAVEAALPGAGEMPSQPPVEIPEVPAALMGEVAAPPPQPSEPPVFVSGFTPTEEPVADSLAAERAEEPFQPVVEDGGVPVFVPGGAPGPVAEVPVEPVVEDGGVPVFVPGGAPGPVAEEGEPPAMPDEGRTAAAPAYDLPEIDLPELDPAHQGALPDSIGERGSEQQPPAPLPELGPVEYSQPGAASPQVIAQPAPVPLPQMSPPMVTHAVVPPPAGGLVSATVCQVGHPNPPGSMACRQCNRPVGSISRLVPRPVLAVVRSSFGTSLELSSPILVGRAPDTRGDTSVQIMKVPSPNTDISRSHLRLQGNEWTIEVMDLNSTNGSVVAIPGQAPVSLVPGQATPVPLGAIVDLGDGVQIRIDPPR